MKRKFLAKAITLGLMLAVPLGAQAADITTEVNDEVVTTWDGQIVSNGGITNRTIVSAAGARQLIKNGGIANDTILSDLDNGNARQDIESGGTANRTNMGKNSRVHLHGGNTNNLVNKGGWFLIASGKAKGTTVNSGKIVITPEKLKGVTEIQQGAILENTIINNGGISVTQATIDGRAYGNNAQISGTTINNGWIEVNDNTSSFDNTTAYGGKLTFNNVKSLTSTILKNDVVLTANAGTINTIELSNKSQVIFQGNANVENVTVSGDSSDAYSAIHINDNAVVDGLILNSYGMCSVNGGQVSNVTINRNGWQGVLGGTVNNVTIKDGGRQNIYANQKSSNITIEAGGELVVNQNSEAENVIADGTVFVRDTGKLTGNTVLNKHGNIDLGGIVNPIYDDAKLQGHEDSGSYTIDNLTSNGGTVSAFGEGQELTIDKLAGTDLTLNTEVAKSGLVKINNNDGADITIKASGDVTDSFGNDIQGGMNKLIDSVQIANGSQKATATAAAGAVTGETTITRDENGNTSAAVEEVNKDNAGISEMASIGLMAWRAENNDMNKRLGELRSSKGEHGVWTRMVRGQSKYGAQGIKNQYSTYQLGYDEKLSVNKHWIVGAAVSYTDASSSFTTGHGDNKSTGLAVYGSYLGDNGSFVDLIAKVARLKNEFDVMGGAGKGDYETNGYSLSAEYGKRFTKDNGFWIEPQVELTYGYVGAVDYLTSNDVSVRQNGMDSLVGRIGFSIGRDIKAGNVYARASYLYDFDGETDVTFSKGNATRSFKQDLGGGWWEVGVGTNLSLSDATHLYFDVEKTYSGNVATPWQWNAGVRWSF